MDIADWLALTEHVCLWDIYRRRLTSSLLVARVGLAGRLFMEGAWGGLIGRRQKSFIDGSS